MPSQGINTGSNPVGTTTPRLLVPTLSLLCLLASALFACAVPSTIRPTTEGTFTHLATYRGVGSVLASLVGPGSEPGSERLYQSYLYEGGTLDFVSVDPEAGTYQVFPCPVARESGAWAMALGPDGNLYLGTLPTAHILQFNPRTGVFADRGRPSGTEQYIWGLALGADGKLYGGTYPSAKLIRFDPTIGVGEDLGRMDPSEQYARTIAASDDGFVYVGIGYARANLMAYEIATGLHRDLLPAELRTNGFVTVQRRADGKVYAWIGRQYFRMEGWNAVLVAAAQLPDAVLANRLQDGRLVTVADGTVRLSDPKTNAVSERPFLYAGKEKNVFRLALGPDGQLYGSGYMPAQFFRVNPMDGNLTKLGELGGGEFYSFAQHGERLLGAAYYGLSPLAIYDPRRPFAPGTDSQSNPVLVHYNGEDVEWRPAALIAGPDGKVYVGAIPGYGKLGGTLTVWDTATHRVESYPNLMTDLSIVSLAFANGLLVGGTTITGGGGSHETQAQAKLFIWDPQAKRKVFESDPLPAGTISDLITAPNGRVYGFAGTALFAFDPVARQVVFSQSEPVPGRIIYNSMAVGPDGLLWGLASEGIFTVDPVTDTVKIMARPPAPISAGFAMGGMNLYFASGPKTYRYTLPSAR